MNELSVGMFLAGLGLGIYFGVGFTRWLLEREFRTLYRLTQTRKED